MAGPADADAHGSHGYLVTWLFNYFIGIFIGNKTGFIVRLSYKTHTDNVLGSHSAPPPPFLKSSLLLLCLAGSQGGPERIIRSEWKPE